MKSAKNQAERVCLVVVPVPDAHAFAATKVDKSRYDTPIEWTAIRNGDKRRAGEIRFLAELFESWIGRIVQVGTEHSIAGIREERR
jgi:hypothetical protein